jgi:hypothetical protein
MIIQNASVTASPISPSPSIATTSTGACHRAQGPARTSARATSSATTSLQGLDGRRRHALPRRHRQPDVPHLSEEGINIQMISTSEIKISVVVDEKYMELAVRVLHKAFGLEMEPV